MGDLIGEFIQYGALGLVAAVSLYQVYTMQKQLFNLIKENITAITRNTDVTIELKDTIKDCHRSRERTGY